MGNKQNSTTIVKNFKESEGQAYLKKNSKEKPITTNSGIVDKNSFDFLYVIGRGGFGKVKI